MLHGSAISLIRDRTGSVSISWMIGVLPFSCWSTSMEKTAARSNRKPSTCISVTQYRRQSRMNLRTTGWLQFSVLPQPVKSL